MNGKLQSFWKSIGSHHRLLLGVIGVAVVAILCLGFKGAGSITYEGWNYEAGSLFLPEEYGDIYDRVRNPEGVRYVNHQLGSLRNKVLLPIIVSLAGAGFAGYHLYRDDEFMKEFFKIM